MRLSDSVYIFPSTVTVLMMNWLPCFIPWCFLHININLYLKCYDFMSGSIHFHGSDMSIQQTGDGYCWFCYFPSKVVCARAHLPAALLSQWVRHIHMFSAINIADIVHLVFDLQMCNVPKTCLDVKSFWSERSNIISSCWVPKLMKQII
jgi:hypothetical protein